MVNLLPKQEQIKLRGLYYSRLVSAFLFVLAFVCLAGAVLLIPSYIVAKEKAENAVLKLQEANMQANKEVPIKNDIELGLLKERISILQEHNRQSAIPYVLSRALDGRPSNVHITSLTFIFKGDGEGSVTLAGKADSRNALISFAENLKKESAFAGATVPVSDLVQETNIQFSLPLQFNLKTP
ncbi:hypothetical protein EPO56_02580 [Patescibacteria group bacterium]|nr:MAG: hypothetical protein EPO56_02580 [Patescibacteria group bacterium]